MAAEGFPAWIRADWPAPSNVHAYTTIRLGGVSSAPYDSLNLGGHVGDDPGRVAENRRILGQGLGLPSDPVWLDQVHGVQVAEIDMGSPGRADGAWTAKKGVVCVVLTADCLPVLLCDQAGTRVAALHAGWRGLAAGILEAGVHAMGTEGLLAWFGPAIGPRAFEVGGEVREAFLDVDAGAANAFVLHATGKWLADIYVLARRRLQALGVQAVTGGDYCTYNDAQRFFSYRRDGVCGRMASLIWLDGSG